ncbi:MAG: DUF484 family protein [Gammaproteobacteria bacterium]|nr:DUF484 family protein [Gammaproteobacteria bacterium]
MANTERSAAGQLNAERVAEYLREHPEFLDERPDLLSTLSLSHDMPPGVSSLIEKQVSALRTENRRYRQQVKNLHKTQEDIRALIDLAHQLSLRILQSPEAETACDILYDFVHNDYEADQATLFLFLDDNPFTSATIVDIRDRHDRLRLLLAELFNRKQPLLDSLQSEHLSLMFGDTRNQIHSTILMPLIGQNWDGLLVVGSHQRDRYRRGPELELLVYLARITAIKLDDWLTANGS